MRRVLEDARRRKTCHDAERKADLRGVEIVYKIEK